MVGRRDAYWASGGSAVTNSLLLSAVWVVGAVFADRNAPALGGILNQQGVGNSTMVYITVLENGGALHTVTSVFCLSSVLFRFLLEEIHERLRKQSSISLSSIINE